MRVASSGAMVMVSAVFAAAVEIKSIRPWAAPLVISMRWGVAAVESCPAVQPAPEAVIVVAVTPVIRPVALPVIEASSSSGIETSEVFFVVPVPAEMLIFRSRTYQPVLSSFRRHIL